MKAMKMKLMIGITFLGVIFFSQKMSAQADTSAYLVMKVNDAILDCPHFMGIFKRVEFENHWKEIERNQQKRYLIIAYPKTAEYNMLEKFREELKKMNFPMGVVTDLYLRDNLSEIKKELN